MWARLGSALGDFRSVCHGSGDSAGGWLALFRSAAGPSVVLRPVLGAQTAPRMPPERLSASLPRGVPGRRPPVGERRLRRRPRRPPHGSGRSVPSRLLLRRRLVCLPHMPVWRPRRPTPQPLPARCPARLRPPALRPRLLGRGAGRPRRGDDTPPPQPRRPLFPVKADRRVRPGRGLEAGAGDESFHAPGRAAAGRPCPPRLSRIGRPREAQRRRPAREKHVQRRRGGLAERSLQRRRPWLRRLNAPAETPHRAAHPRPGGSIIPLHCCRCGAKPPDLLIVDRGRNTASLWSCALPGPLRRDKCTAERTQAAAGTYLAHSARKS